MPHLGFEEDIKNLITPDPDSVTLDKIKDICNMQGKIVELKKVCVQVCVISGIVKSIQLDTSFEGAMLSLLFNLVYLCTIGRVKFAEVVEIAELEKLIAVEKMTDHAIKSHVVAEFDQYYANSRYIMFKPSRFELDYFPGWCQHEEKKFRTLVEHNLKKQITSDIHVEAGLHFEMLNEMKFNFPR